MDKLKEFEELAHALFETNKNSYWDAIELAKQFFLKVRADERKKILDEISEIWFSPYIPGHKVQEIIIKTIKNGHKRKKIQSQVKAIKK